MKKIPLQFILDHFERTANVIKSAIFQKHVQPKLKGIFVKNRGEYGIGLFLINVGGK
jgi:hypothetical protein